MYATDPDTVCKTKFPKKCLVTSVHSKIPFWTLALTEKLVDIRAITIFLRKALTDS